MISQDCLQSSTNYTMISDCCCTLNCFLMTDSLEPESLLNLSFISSDFIVSNVLIDGNPPSFPYLIGNISGATLSFQICPPNDIVNGSLDIVIDGDGYSDTQTINIKTILNDYASVTSIDFGTVAIGQNTLYTFIWNPSTDYLMCCRNFSLGGLSAPFTFDSIYPTNFQLCDVANQSTTVIFAPTSVGTFNDTITVQIDECNSFQIPVTGKAIEPIDGASNGQKNKVDQTTRVEACSPRTANNRCQTARTMQTAIRTNARRFGKR